MQRDGSALLRETLESMWVAMLVTTPEGKIMDANRSACTLLGYTREELLSMGIADIVGLETAECLRKTMREQSPGGEISIESNGFRKGGARIPVQLSNTAIRIGDEDMVVTMMRVSSNSKERWSHVIQEDRGR